MCCELKNGNESTILTKFFFRFFNIPDQKLRTFDPPTGRMEKSKIELYRHWKCLNLSNFGKFNFFYLNRFNWPIPNRCTLIHPNHLSKYRGFCLFVELFTEGWYRTDKKIYQSLVPNVGNIFQYFIVHIWALMWFMTLPYTFFYKSEWAWYGKNCFFLEFTFGLAKLAIRIERVKTFVLKIKLLAILQPSSSSFLNVGISMFFHNLQICIVWCFNYLKLSVFLFLHTPTVLMTYES